MKSVNGFGRCSPLRVEINPWVNDEQLEKVLLYRGAFVSAVASVETTLTEFAIRLSKLPEYEALRPHFPVRRNARTAYIRRVVGEPGPMKKYETLITAILARYEQSSSWRDLLAHGRMSVLGLGRLPTTAEFDDFFADGHTVVHRREPIALNTLRCRAHRACSFSRAVQRVYGRATAYLPDW